MPRPSTVVIAAPSTAASGVRQARRGSPSTRTVQAPQPPCWQPAFVLVIAELLAQRLQQRRQGRRDELALVAVDRQSHQLSSVEGRSARAATSTGSVRCRYQAEASASSAGATSSSARAAAASASAPSASARSTEVRRRRGARAGRGEPQLAAGARAADRAGPCRRARAAGRTAAVRAGLRRVERPSSTSRPSGPAARKSSTGSVRSPPAPAERTCAPSAISARLEVAARALARPAARRGCRRASPGRGPRGRRRARGGRAERLGRATRARRRGVIAPTVDPAAVVAHAGQARRGRAAAPARGAGARALSSTVRIVPPPNTVTSPPSPKAATASSGDVGTRTSGACEGATAMRPLLLLGTSA